MSEEQAEYFRVELARTPSDFLPPSVAEIEAGLDRRWAEYKADGGDLDGDDAQLRCARTPVGIFSLVRTHSQRHTHTHTHTQTDK